MLSKQSTQHSPSFSLFWSWIPWQDAWPAGVLMDEYWCFCPADHQGQSGKQTRSIKWRRVQYYETQSPSDRQWASLNFKSLFSSFQGVFTRAKSCLRIAVVLANEQLFYSWCKNLLIANESEGEGTSVYLPVMKYRETESLSLSVCSQISFKSKRVDSGDESFDCVQRWTRNWCILSDIDLWTIRKTQSSYYIKTIRNPHFARRRAYAQNVSFKISLRHLFCLYQLQWPIPFVLEIEPNKNPAL